MIDKHKVTSLKDNVMSRHDSMHGAITHVAESLEARGLKSTVKNAIEHGFKIERDKEHNHAEHARHGGSGSHDPAYENSKKNK